MEKQNILELEENSLLRSQKREWMVKRIASIVIWAVVILAAVGLFGRGPLSSTTIEDQKEGVRLGFDRFLHYQAPTEIEVRIPVSAGNSGRFYMSRSYLLQFEVKAIVPEPATVETTDAAFLYTFAAAPGVAALQVKFHLNPTTLGPVAGYAAIEGGKEHHFTQLVYP